MSGESERGGDRHEEEGPSGEMGRPGERVSEVSSHLRGVSVWWLTMLADSLPPRRHREYWSARSLIGGKAQS